jgi:hypothetical protein
MIQVRVCLEIAENWSLGEVRLIVVVRVDEQGPVVVLSRRLEQPRSRELEDAHLVCRRQRNLVGRGPAAGRDLELLMSIIIKRPDGSSMNVQSP